MVKGTLIVNGARTPNSARKPNGARWTEWRTRGLSIKSYLKQIIPPPVHHSKSQIDWNSSVSETIISLQNRYSCMYLMENNLKHFYDINVI